MEYKYDMLGNLVYQSSMDAGQRWLLTNILGNPLRTWDERYHEFQYFYDILHRPIQSKVLGGDGTKPLDNIFDRILYGESQPNPEIANLRGQMYRHYDTGGLIETAVYDFKGQPITTKRTLFRKYKEVANWIDDNLDQDLESDEFAFTTLTDALGRITKQTAPDGSIITPSYNEAGLLNGEKVQHTGSTLESTYIQNIDYNEKGQRNLIEYGNGVITSFVYDRATFRMKRLSSKKNNGDPLQDWDYTFDPVGNITHIKDKNIPTVFFDNHMIIGESAYTYDALYRLIEATGRENTATINFDSSDNWNDTPFMHEVNPGDPLAVRNYTQSFQYDRVGNITRMAHNGGSNGSWTRIYSYESGNNRLISTQAGSMTYTYIHHPKHGYITGMPHLQDMDWNFKEELVKTIKQSVIPGNGTPETTYYQYDGQGQRIRKITENQVGANITPTKKEERIYIAGYETYRTYQSNVVDFERESLSLMDEGHRFVMVEIVKQNTNADPKPSEMVGSQLVRYQMHNHLGSACLEMDCTAQVISYEEYHPYGTTAYQAKNSSIKAAGKRYRYTGMERDEESGFEYHSARYYLPWLGRWLSPDPIGIKDGTNSFCYCRNTPVLFVDDTGLQIGNSNLGDKLLLDYNKKSYVAESTGRKNSPEVLKAQLEEKKNEQIEKQKAFIESDENQWVLKNLEKWTADRIRKEFNIPTQPAESYCSAKNAELLSQKSSIKNVMSYSDPTLYQQASQTNTGTIKQGKSEFERWAEVMIAPEVENMVKFDPGIKYVGLVGFAVAAITIGSCAGTTYWTQSSVNATLNYGSQVLGNAVAGKGFSLYNNINFTSIASEFLPGQKYKTVFAKNIASTYFKTTIEDKELVLSSPFISNTKNSMFTTKTVPLFNTSSEFICNMYIGSMNKEFKTLKLGKTWEFGFKFTTSSTKTFLQKSDFFKD
jgi:RHS repeat-associated protein